MFTTTLKTEYIDGKFWRLLDGLIYKTNTSEFTVPEGYVTDFGTIPRFFWRLVGPPTGCGNGAAYGPAAVLHDYLYEYGLTSRAVADHIFYEAMLSLNVDRWRAWIMWKAVRLAGWYPWKRYRKKDPSKKV